MGSTLIVAVPMGVHVHTYHHPHDRTSYVGGKQRLYKHNEAITHYSLKMLVFWLKHQLYLYTCFATEIQPVTKQGIVKYLPHTHSGLLLSCVPRSQQCSHTGSNFLGIN